MNVAPAPCRGAVKGTPVKNRLIILLATIGLIVATAPSASAATFDLAYLHKVTYLSASQSTACGSVGTNTANIEVEAYNVRQTDGSISRVYNIDMDGDIRDNNFDLNSARVEIEGVRQSATNNFTVKFADQNARRDIRGVWWMGACAPYAYVYNM